METILLSWAGAIIGWLIVEFVAVLSKARFPITLNIPAAIAGAIIGAYWR
jgi:hypothetical protein